MPEKRNRMEGVQMNMADMMLKGVMKLGLEKKMWETSQAIKKEANLPERDWVPYIQEMSIYPTEVQTVIEAPNEDHVALYDEDLEMVEEERKKSLKLIDSMVPHYHPIDWMGERTIELVQKEPTYTIASMDRKKRPGIDMDYLGTKLYLVRDYLYEGKSDADLALTTQVAFNSYETLLEESEKNVRIAQKGKAGEDYVSRVLQQCRGRFLYLENVVIPAYEEKGKTSETDVYIINSKGVFVCEVKNYGKSGQTLVIPNTGDWKIYEEDRFLKSKPSAFVQNERHCNATSAFIKEHLGIEVPIIPVIIIANDEVMIDRQTQNAVIRAGDIYSFVENWQDAVDYRTQEQIVQAFEENMLDVNDFPVKLNRDRAGYLSSVIEELVPYLQANEKIAVELTKMHVQGETLSKILMLMIAVLCIIPAIGSGFMGIGVVIIYMLLVYCARSTLATILGCVSLVCLIVVFLTASPTFLAVSLIGAVLSGRMTFKNAG